jgi:hypothetical protein
VDGPHAVPYAFDVDGVTWHLRAGDVVEVESEPIRNPVTGAEVHPGAVLPEGLIFKEGRFGSSKRFAVGRELGLDHSGRYTAIGRFDYSGP